MTTAFPIQSATIADALAGRDVLGKARTGSGKTLGFGLPAIARLADGDKPAPTKPRAIVLVPTRELAMQVNDALEPFAHSMGVSLRLVAGGLSMTKQVQALERGVHLLVATPGRLADLTRRGHADMSDVELIVLDEADHMADMGFMDEINEILEHVPAGGQRLLFSATLDGDVDRLVAEHMVDPVLHDVTGGDDGPASMTHLVLSIPPHVKYQLAHRIVAREGRTIVFVRSKLACDRIAGEMRDAGVLAVSLHGDKSQAERNHAITGFRAGQIPVLVATDVAARGIHVDAVDLVLQMDPPSDFKDYTHRAGRTARAGSAGIVVTLSLPHQRKTVDRLIDNAGVDAIFRKVRGEDQESLALLSELTGAREPSGVPVPEPLPDSALRGRGGRGRPDRGGRGRTDRNGRERPARTDYGARADRTRRPARGRDDFADESRTARENALLAREERLARREAELEARERDVAQRGRSRDYETGPARRGGSRDRSPERATGRTRGDDDNRRGSKPEARRQARGDGDTRRPPRTETRRDSRFDDRRDSRGGSDSRGASDSRRGSGRSRDAQAPANDGRRRPSSRQRPQDDAPSTARDRGQARPEGQAFESKKGASHGKKKSAAKQSGRSGKARPKNKGQGKGKRSKR
ncbi:DEAD/DEAH box helicase [Demequina globuliformis]|uniref:DEAD/DEAH box helicase n=1 Tax=Demequina globuliformis TaxID=676202 RepID=UPI000A925AE7|nr:DEAD/DEAH box helicase [Demequina globuliformis]